MVSGPRVVNADEVDRVTHCEDGTMPVMATVLFEGEAAVDKGALRVDEAAERPWAERPVITFHR